MGSADGSGSGADDGGSMVLAQQAVPANPTATPLGGPAGPALDVAFCLLPVVFLLVVTLSKRLFMPTSRSLPYAAAMLWAVKMSWIGEDPIHITATIMQGGLLALTPLSILLGAFIFFNCLTATQTMPYIAALVRATCHGHPVAEVMLVLWAMGHLIEGASGFGTGPAMLPPIMAALGHSPFESVVCLLVMTTCVGPFGSSGIGLWFGLSALEWERARLVRVTFLVAVCMTVMSFPVCWLGARVLLTWRDVRGCWPFVLLSITSCALPALLGAVFSFEAPGLMSGVLGVVFTGVLARRQLGLSQQVPCVVARRLRELEAGAAVVDGSQDDGRQGQLVVEEHGQLPSRMPAQRASSGVPLQQRDPKSIDRPMIELMAVAASSYSCPAATAPSWKQQQGKGSPQQQQQPSEDGTDAAQGLLHALVATSPAWQAHPAEQQRSGSHSSAPAALESSADELGDEAAADEDEDGGSELLPTQAVRSYHELAGYRSTISLLTAPGEGEISRHETLQRQCQPASASATPAGAMPAGGGDATAAYLSDRRELALRLLPWAAMLAVVAGTRVPYLQKSNGHELRLHLRSLGDLSLSTNLVLQFKDLCRIGVNWSFALLYVPSLLPFICTGCATLAAFRRSIPQDKSWQDPFVAAAAKCKSVAPAIIGALILVALMVQGGRQAPSYIIGYWLSEWLGRGYIAVSMLLGGIGSFFSGSVATSNLTFGLLQQVAAQKLNLNATAMVALQIVGAAAGQCISISNILGGRAVMGLQHIPEGRFVTAALPACLAFYMVGTVLALPFLFS